MVPKSRPSPDHLQVLQAVTGAPIKARYGDGGYMSKESFISLCIAGRISAAEIDDYVERWHKNEIGQEVDLAACLGMDTREYDSWVRDPAELSAIIAEHAARTRRNP
jgi:hypothetical protein